MLLMRHAAIFVTGMSGVGKSTALTELARRGFTTVDTDYGPWIHVVDGEPLWRQPMIDALLDRPRDTPLFVQGSAANQGRFYSRFDAACSSVRRLRDSKNPVPTGRYGRDGDAVW